MGRSMDVSRLKLALQGGEDVNSTKEAHSEQTGLLLALGWSIAIGSTLDISTVIVRLKFYDMNYKSPGLLI